MTIIAGISYLNSRPYFYPFLSGMMKSRYQIELMTPAEANDAVMSGRAVGGLISSVAWAGAQDRLVRIPGLEIASQGDVQSILLLGEKDIRAMKRIAVTVESATSVRMLRILLTELYPNAELVSSESPWAYLHRGEADGALLIGDAALAAGAAVQGRDGIKSEYRAWDLGRLWQEEFRIPMVYAVFAVNRGHAGDREAIEAELRGALEWSRDRLDEIVRSPYTFPSSGGGLKRPVDLLPLLGAAGMIAYLEQFETARNSPDLDSGLENFLVQATKIIAAGQRRTNRVSNEG